MTLGGIKQRGNEIGEQETKGKHQGNDTQATCGFPEKVLREAARTLGERAVGTGLHLMGVQSVHTRISIAGNPPECHCC
jgi:hypothetical protein